LLVAAGLVASCQPASNVETERVRADVALAADVMTTEAVVPPNATLETLLSQQVSAELARSVVEAVRGVFNPRDLRADQTYQIIRGLDGLFREFRYDIDADNILRIVFRDRPGAPAAVFDVAVLPAPKEYRLDAASVEISAEHRSLIEAFDATGENIQLPLRLSEMFGGEVDFNSDLRRGDGVQVLFDRVVRRGEFVGYGDVRAAVLNVGRKRVTAIRYVGPEGKAAYYNEQGRSLRRQFLKSPLPFSPRVTSPFSYNRFHPVLGGARPHLGVDYGAPFGTRVNAAAAGVVEAAEWAGDAGRMVKIRHPGGYETAYLHLSSFGPGIRAGARVEQGALIGRVGQTGTATGPHLDYRIIKNGVYVNPVNELAKMPPGESIASDRLGDFRERRDEALQQLQETLHRSTDGSPRSGADAR
jgi:murein DD-endopeptidase MepM/ murein hydrolase activator NlpD